MWRNATAKDAARITTNEAGNLRVRRGQRRRRARDAAAPPMAAPDNAPTADPRPAHLSRKEAERGRAGRPSRSGTWEEKMITAMPLVNPVTTGYGINLIAPPNRPTPRRT